MVLNMIPSNKKRLMKYAIFSLLHGDEKTINVPGCKYSKLIFY